MENIYSLIQKVKEINIRKINLKDLISRLEKEIDEDKSNLNQLLINNLNKEITSLESYRDFLEHYPSYFCNWFRKLMKNILITFLSTGLVFIFLLICICFSYNLKIDIFKLLTLMFLSSLGFSVYGVFIIPIISNYRYKMELLNRFGAKENIEFKLMELHLKQNQIDEKIYILRENLIKKEERLNILLEKIDELKALENDTNVMLTVYADNVLTEVVSENYIYDCSDLEPIVLNKSLKNKKTTKFL